MKQEDRNKLIREATLLVLEKYADTFRELAEYDKTLEQQKP